MRIWLIGKKGLLAQAYASFLQQKKKLFFQTSKEEVDITQENKVEEVFYREKPTHVINCAAEANVDFAEEHPEKAFLLNTKAPENLGKKSHICHAKILHISTDYVFDGEKGSAYTEEDIPNPINIYGKTKREGELALIKENPESLIIRTAWLFGFGKKGFFHSLYENLLKQKEVGVISDKIGSPTFCKDLVEASLLLYEKTGIYHVVNQDSASRYELATKFLSFLQKKSLLQDRKIVPTLSSSLPKRALRPTYSVLQTTNLEKELSFKMRNWEEALEEYLEKETFYESCFQ